MSSLPHGHISVQSSPGSLWVPKADARILYGSHSTVTKQLFSDLHYHVFIRYAYVVAKLHFPETKKYIFWRDLYEKMQIKRVGFADIEAFDRLILDFQQTGGYDDEFPIPVDKRYNILDGAHRVACAAALGYMPSVVVYDVSSHAYNKAWFKGNNFSPNELEEVDAVRASILESHISGEQHTILIWGCALPFWNDILKLFDPTHVCSAYIMDPGPKFRAFVLDAYEADGMDFNRIVAKSEALAATSTSVGVFQVTQSLESLIALKKEIRTQFAPLMKNYFFDNIIHVVDVPEVGERLVAKYGLQNSK